ncbi:tRNA lysidine(34) synthetase TilS [Selenomonas sp.]|uniref:tRNA lysidine(34) synthetase TilS n=1 Tax=Selenomonas sp. TaxID=2053611 RepID=UPI0025D9D1B0|nr:tRNA lysidine(34) synthetase TilS [Selenomonas sp.]MCI6284123.1 tRNA lysidine(34) synthetase TilS [Selenomonas sp.]
MTKLAKRLYEHLKRTALLPRGTHVLVACSGGPDSLALLLLLAELAPMLHLDVSAAHYDHSLRGAASQEDAAFVAAFCAARDIPCRMGRAPAGSIAAADASIETAARAQRYVFLETARQAAGADVICTAHHADDQAETVLMHLLRGTGLDGLAGIPARDDARHLVRPLLPLRKAELVAYCAQRGVTPRHDATNDVPDGLRNRVRLELLPELAASYNPRITESLCRLAATAAEDSAALEQEAERACRKATRMLAAEYRYWQRGREIELPASLGLSAEALRQLPRGMARRVLRRYLVAIGHTVDVSLERTDALLAFLASGKGNRIEFPGFDIMLAHGWLRPGVVHLRVY